MQKRSFYSASKGTSPLKDLNSCIHVFLRDHARKSLERSHTGPHKVLKRATDRIFEIDVNGISRYVSVENIKPAYFMRDGIDQLQAADTAASVLLLNNVRTLIG